MTSTEIMTPRERVLTALDHRKPDRTPRDFWAEEPTWQRSRKFTDFYKEDYARAAEATGGRIDLYLSGHDKYLSG